MTWSTSEIYRQEAHNSTLIVTAASYSRLNMYDIKRLLVVVSREDDCTLVLEKAQILAAAAHANTFVVKVVHDDLVESSLSNTDSGWRLKSVIMEAEQTRFEDLVHQYKGQFEHIELMTTWNKREWDGVKAVSRAINADLIIKVANEEMRIQEAVHTPDDWNLLRSADCPVMLVKPQQWENGPVVIAAVDIMDETHQQMNESILKEADSLTRVLGGDLHIANAYPLLEPWVGDLDEEFSYTEIKDDVVTDIQTKMLGSTLSSQVEVEGLHIREGKPSMVIRDVTEEFSADLLVMGTAGRSGVVGAVMGNTSETLLRMVNTDVVTLRREVW